ncbi:MAG: hypothetical protein AVDCRST_MAG08-3061, partial [uncultured Acetobacteraceae bacterium]
DPRLPPRWPPARRAGSARRRGRRRVPARDPRSGRRGFAVERHRRARVLRVPRRRVRRRALPRTAEPRRGRHPGLAGAQVDRGPVSARGRPGRRPPRLAPSVGGELPGALRGSAAGGRAVSGAFPGGAGGEQRDVHLLAGGRSGHGRRPRPGHRAGGGLRPARARGLQRRGA